MIRRALVAGALALAAITSAAAAQPAGGLAAGPVVKVRQGALQGASADGVSTWLGIPYAAPPVGELRWRPPAAGPSWRGVREATKPGASCEKDVEDCLYLNVTAPAGTKPGAKLPVMVWIHGGGFVIGTSMGSFGATHDGTEFARKGVITVSLNYRLGHAGWFAHPALDREGHTANYGLADQIAALKWVQANIASFGGDPRNVTVFGESAGGISVLYLMLTPEAKGLFQKAIGESSFPRHTPNSLEKADGMGVRAAKAAGVDGADAATAAALRALPLSKLPYEGGFVERAQPILDGKLIVSGIAQGFAAGRQAKVPLIVGGNSNEASLFRPKAEDLDKLPAAAQAAVLAAYDPDHTSNRLKIVNDFVTDTYITEPDRNLARTATKAGEPVWLYFFSFVPEKTRATALGAGHVNEVRFVWGGEKQRFAPEEVPVSKAMNAYWAAFAKSGNPDSAGGMAWPKFDAAHEASLEFGADGVTAREHQFKDRLDLAEKLQGK
ncbi:carboxylesterase/lipase family protein [Phenylobacterium soli]|uniref:Carboxylic ester hydrolase n=1 Tax=Phenylobacterium soli TaxID=2170551 RepID=A0A328AGD2_9CAUL|nr:carboxylesterase family protein [Phenylobacterium soli]RAK53802.1 carboxylesterase family protein [Phenylobacterium soli]